MQGTEKPERASSDEGKRKSSLLCLLGSQDECPICLDTFDLIRKVPMMICLNQHSSCDQCLKDVYSKKKCPVCSQPLIRRLQVKKNRIVCSLIEELIRANGEQYIQCPKFKYRGQVKKGKRNGYGEQITDQGHLYKGNFKSGQLTGECEVLTKQGAKFQGEAVDGNLVGTFVTKYGSTIEGTFTQEGLAGVSCKKKYTNGDMYEGNIKNLKADGFGLLTLKNGNSFEGYFTKDYIESNGRGKIMGTFPIEINAQRIQIHEIQEQIRTIHDRNEESVSESPPVLNIDSDDSLDQSS